MGRVLVTGGSGFIGRSLVAGLLEDGWEVTTAGRRPVAAGPRVRHLDWSLGAPLPVAPGSLDAVIHCACATIAADTALDQAMQLDIAGTERLIAQCREAPAVRFVFLSSQSASPQARNAYGRSKYAIEQRLTRPQEVIVRPGLVYDEAGTGVYGTAIRLVRSVRILPDLGTRPCIQPIHVADLVTGLRRLAGPGAGGTVCLGAVTPLDFAGFCRRVAAREGLPAPILVPGLGAVTLGALGLAARFGLFANLHERVAGLVALQPMETDASLARIGLTLRAF